MRWSVAASTCRLRRSVERSISPPFRVMMPTARCFRRSHLMSKPSRDGRDWTRDEVVFALGLYFQIPWGKINPRNPTVR